MDVKYITWSLQPFVFPVYCRCYIELDLTCSHSLCSQNIVQTEKCTIWPQHRSKLTT